MQRSPADADPISSEDPIVALAQNLRRTCGLQGALSYARQEHMAGVVAALLALADEPVAAAA